MEKKTLGAMNIFAEIEILCLSEGAAMPLFFGRMERRACGIRWRFQRD